ncbi:unnamed protein product [Rotaria sp. Silwood2]|nr:unnamed protein product [Rotaria sp. Silwood2]CAF3281445.1 unnamed protein product [Rotaria sp. Silwood2]CAF4436759.1 unnamed protein product [Rotaria sp. Silwood2]CAF4467358.1 unnamed protein product [Rotaria sp. Silwood2]
MLTSVHLKVISILSILICILSIAGLITLIVIWHTKLTPFKDYAVVVDAGSTHSKIFLYTWPADKSDGLGLTSRVTQVKACSVPGGPITSIKDPTENNAQQYFQSAMTDCISKIPSTRKRRAYIFLGGTAGLRLFDMKNSSYTKNLLNSTRAYFSTLGVHFKAPENQVRIISGSEEGLSGWISTNILMGKLLENNQPLETYGVSDMGGASTQISFIAPNAANDSFNMNLFDTEYDIYSHSYLCYGTEQLRLLYLGQLVNDANGSLLIDEPCLQIGYIQNLTYDDIFNTPCIQNQSIPLPSLNVSSIFSFIGSGNFSVCSDTVRERLNKSACTSKDCSFNNVYQPVPIPPSNKFIAISAWYTTFNNLAPNVSLSPNKDGNFDFNSVNFNQIKAAIAAICSQPWSDMSEPDKYRPFLCFNSMYHWTLLEYGYSMTDENLKNFHIVKSINSNDIGWTLGYMINQTNAIDPELRPTRLITKNEFGGLLFLCLFFLILSAIITIIAMKYYKRRRYY